MSSFPAISNSVMFEKQKQNTHTETNEKHFDARTHVYFELKLLFSVFLIEMWTGKEIFC